MSDLLGGQFTFEYELVENDVEEEENVEGISPTSSDEEQNLLKGDEIIDALSTNIREKGSNILCDKRKGD